MIRLLKTFPPRMPLIENLKQIRPNPRHPRLKKDPFWSLPISVYSRRERFTACRRGFSCLKPSSPIGDVDVLYFDASH